MAKRSVARWTTSIPAARGTGALEHGGTISAEHGVGTAKARWLPHARQPAEYAALIGLKRWLDPAGLLNAGVVLSG